MKIPICKQTAVVFDLDDTLYKECDFLASGFREIGRQLGNDGHAIAEQMIQWHAEGKGDVLGAARLAFNIDLSIAELLDIYRNHQPNIHLTEPVSACLRSLKRHGIPLGCITDGRSVTQRNKLHALGILDDFDAVLISGETGSEKPAEANFKQLMTALRAERYCYIGDNTAKDFVSPNKLGWISGCLVDDGRNVHPQDLSCPVAQRPTVCINALTPDVFLLT